MSRASLRAVNEELDGAISAFGRAVTATTIKQKERLILLGIQHGEHAAMNLQQWKREHPTANDPPF